MKRLIVCCDGTWNNPDQEDNGIPAPTNVMKLYNALLDKDPDTGVVQRRFYQPGVGGEGGLFEKVSGGAVGAGISRNICSAYHWLASHYKEGDEIYLYGFSRGAFTARSLGAFLGRGLLDLDGQPPPEAWRRVNAAYNEGYRVMTDYHFKKLRAQNPAKAFEWAHDWPFFSYGEAIPIRFIGVWDTVGALGVPDDLEVFNFFDDKSKWQFHDTELGEHVRTARHAMAIDEIRSVFSVTRWTNNPPHPGARELWFPGVHADVGGGYAESGLSDGALSWMIEESEAVGIKFRPDVRGLINPNPGGVLHNSYKGAFARLRSRPRRVDAVIPENSELFHTSVFERQRISPLTHPPYCPTRRLAVGQSAQVEIRACKHWSPTWVYLEAGEEYVFDGRGQWQDAEDACDWKGTEDSILTRGDIVRAAGSFLGQFEGLIRRATKNHATDFLGTKRVEDIPWFAMVGAVTNDDGKASGVNHDGSVTAHEYFQVSQFADQDHVYPVTASGYLYCFPNDVWSLYDNNHGSIDLTITRVK